MKIRRVPPSSERRRQRGRGPDALLAACPFWIWKYSWHFTATSNPRSLPEICVLFELEQTASRAKVSRRQSYLDASSSQHSRRSSGSVCGAPDRRFSRWWCEHGLLNMITTNFISPLKLLTVQVLILTQLIPFPYQTRTPLATQRNDNPPSYMLPISECPHMYTSSRLICSPYFTNHHWSTSLNQQCTHQVCLFIFPTIFCVFPRMHIFPPAWLSDAMETFKHYWPFSRDSSGYRNFDIFLVISTNKLLNKHSSGRWLGTPLCPYDVTSMDPDLPSSPHFISGILNPTN